MKRRRLVMLAFWAVLLAACQRLSSCRKTDVVARLASFQGHAERVTGGAAWQTAAPGDSFRVGDAVRTGAASRARVQMTSGGALNLGPNSLVRFVAGPIHGATTRIESGEAEIEATDDDLVLDTAQGVAHVARGARVHIQATQGEVRFEVSVGRVVMDQADGGALVATAGQRLRVEVSQAVLEPITTVPDSVRPFVPQPIPSRPTTEPDSGVAVRPTNAGTPTEPAGPTPTSAEVGAEAGAQVVVPAGDSPTIHHAHGSTTVRLGLNGVCDGATVSMDGHALSSPGAATALGAGRHRYQVRCPHARGIVGSIVISRDPGTAPLPRRAPHTTIDTDGRRYSVLYQNLLPEVTVRWPHAPPSGSYLLTVRSATRHPRTQSALEPTVTLPTGQLADGSYTLSFTAGSQQSQDTSLTIAFDDASHRAEIREPADGASGDPVPVSGTALPGSSVMVDGMPLPMDGDHRFHGEAHPHEGVVVIRITPPGRGVHYYVRDVHGGTP